MTADVLRTAAELMRARAEAASRGTWVIDTPDDGGVDVRAALGAGPTVASMTPLDYETRRANAAHVASWHPVVAHAVADWLDVQAERAEIGFSGKTYIHALAVAHTYLGREE